MKVPVIAKNKATGEWYKYKGVTYKRKINPWPTCGVGMVITTLLR